MRTIKNLQRKAVQYYTFIYFVLQIIVSAVFIFYGLSKLLNSKRVFGNNIASYKIIPYSWVNLVALILPIVEILLGILALLAPFSVIANICLICLLLIFQVAIGRALVYGYNIGCGCNGSENTSPFALKKAFFRNCLLITLLVTINIILLSTEGNKSFFVIGIVISTLIIIASFLWLKIFPLLDQQNTYSNNKYKFSRKNFIKLISGLTIIVFSNNNLQSAKALDCGVGVACACKPKPGPVRNDCWACDCVGHPNSHCIAMSYYFVDVSCCGGLSDGVYCGTYTQDVGWVYCRYCP